MQPNNKDTYVVSLNCPLESETPMLINLTEYELNLLKFVENLSQKLSGNEPARPYLILEKFPFDEYKSRKLGSIKQQEFKKILNENKKAYTKIKHEVAKKRQKGVNL